MNMRLVATVVLMASAGCAGTTGSAVPISGNRPAPTTIATDASTTSTTSLAATATTGVVSVVSTTVSPPGTTSPEVLSVDTVRNLSEAWRIEGISGTTSRPVLFEGTIYFGAYDGTLRAVDAETGRQLWTADVGTATLPGSPLVMDELFDRILEIRDSGVAVLMVEQNAAQALAIADRGYVLVTGENRFSDSGQALLEDAEVRRSFLGG